MTYNIILHMRRRTVILRLKRFISITILSFTRKIKSHPNYYITATTIYNYVVDL